MTVVNEHKSAKIQMLRGLAIIAVVFIHTTPEGMAQVICRPFLNFAVGMFLFLSGMLSDAKKWKPFRRIVKVLIPYAIWTLAYTVIQSYRAPGAIAGNYLRHLLFADAAAMMYYVFVYIELTLLIPLIDKLARSRFKYLGFVISPLEIICMRLIPIIFNFQFSEHVNTVMELSCLGWFTYFYLGYLLGNRCIEAKSKTGITAGLWAVSILIQMAEGYWYYSMGISNCGTQLKLSALLSGSLFCILAFRYIQADAARKIPPLAALGNCSFGIYFSHLIVKNLLSLIPGYTSYIIYPFSAVLLLLISFGIVAIGHKILGKFAKYIAF